MSKSASSTPAPLVDRIRGSRKNKAGSAESKKSAQGIKLNASIIAGLTKKAKEYNDKHPKNKVSVTTLKAVMRRGMGAYSSSHRPTITGGAPNTRQAWAYARVNAFLRKKGGQGAKPTYVQDNDLLADGGEVALLKVGQILHLRRLPMFKRSGDLGKQREVNKKVVEVISKESWIDEDEANQNNKHKTSYFFKADDNKKYSATFWGNDLISVSNDKVRYEAINHKLAHGGQLGKEITCVNCGWHWNTNDSDPSDKYVCHKCGYDNRTYYDSEPVGKMADGGVIVKGQLIEYNHSGGASVEAKFLSKVGENKAKIEILNNYTPYTKRVMSKQYVNPAGRTEPANFLKEVPRGTIKIVSVNLIEPITEKTFKHRAKPISKWLKSTEFKEAFGYLDNPTNAMADGGEIILKDDTYQFNGKDRKFKVNEPIFFEFSSAGDKTEALLLKKVDDKKVQIKILKKYTPYRSLKIAGRERASLETRVGFGLGKEEFIKGGVGKEVQEGTIKVVSKEKILPIKNYLNVNYIPYSEEFKDYINNNYDKKNGYWVQKQYMADGGLTKSLAIADIHKKYPELPKKYINAQLYIGMKFEMEHTENPDVAKKIALDHLNESPFYYEYLTKMERQLEGLDVKKHYEEVKDYAKGGEINPDNKGVKDYFAHGSGNVGGVLVGKRHSEGGIKAVNKSTNQPLEMEGGEVVITRNAVSDNEKREFEGEMLTNREILSRINESGGGVSFADGGDIPESINTIGKEYAYGGKMVKDHDIVSSCGCKHTMAEGGKIYGQGGVVSMFDKEIPTYLAFQELFNGLKLPNLRKEYEGFLKENYKINFTQLPQKVRTGLLLGSQKLIDNYINA